MKTTKGFYICINLSLIKRPCVRCVTSQHFVKSIQYGPRFVTLVWSIGRKLPSAL